MTTQPKNCAGGHCGACCGGGCTGACGNGSLSLTERQLTLLRTLAQVAFLPVARRPDEETPIYLEDGYPPAFYANALLGLSLQGLISLDYDLPLSGFDYAAYRDYPLHGSMALTANGQTVIEILETQGVGEAPI